MEFMKNDPTQSVATAKPKKVVKAGQTWTRKLKCTDPACVVNHAGGEQHDFEKVEDEAGDAGEQKEEEEEYVAPADRIVVPLDVISPEPEVGEELIYIVGTRGVKVTRIAGLEYLADSLEELVLRSNLIAAMDGVQSLQKLTKLELYDNQIEVISHIESLTSLSILDLSYNAIRSMAPVACCPLLQELYLAQNKLKVIEGLAGMVHLRCLDLGANRLRSMAGVGLDTLTCLQSLWLGKNKIEKIEDINRLPCLRQFDCQNNRLTTLIWDDEKKGESGDVATDGDSVGAASNTGIAGLTTLEELYLACNALQNLHGMPQQSPLDTIDLSTNQINSLAGVESLQHVTELWMTSSKLSSFEELEPLQALPKLECLYLEHSPLASDFEYRMKVTAMLPSLQQLDATTVSRR